MSSALAFRGAAERYEGWEPVGRGGSATVWRVHDRDLGIPLAIKTLRPELASRPEQVDALRREVLISRALRHPHICPIHDLYEGPRGVGVVMDLLTGEDLRAWLDGNAGRLLDTLPGRVEALRLIAGALAVAHARIVHRDLKPANVFLLGGEIGRPMIMDFGLSVLDSPADGRFAGGTPKYMAPEQLLDPGRVDARADLFALGILAYEMLTDGLIPACSLRDALRTRAVPSVPVSEIPPPSARCAAIPPALDRAVLSLLERDPDRRPASAAEVAAVLASLDLAAARASALAPAPARRGREGVVLPAGAHLVGNARLAAPPAEKPRRRVVLSGCLVSPQPVTRAEYAAFLDATGHRRPAEPPGARPDWPVTGVSWDDAAAYAAWVGGRLPGEMEWEAAARAGDPAAEYPWGPEAPGVTRANLDRVCDGPTPVGSYPAGRNAWGLWDMAGNVWEWCDDAWEEGLLRRLADGARDPRGRGEGALRSIRGGGYDALAAAGRCGARARAPREARRDDLGFRVVFDPPGGET